MCLYLVKSAIINLSQRPYLFNGKIFEVEASPTFINRPNVLTIQTKSDLNPLKKNTVENVTEKVGKNEKKKLSNVIFISEI